ALQRSCGSGCSHSFCKVCLENWWKDKPLRPVQSVRKVLKEEPPLNLALRNLVETFTEERRQTSPSPAQPECILHSEKLRLFCEDHQDLICLVCRDSRTHKDHSFRPIEEAAQELREQLRRDLTPLQENLKVLARSRAQLEFSEAHITAQARRAQTQIRAQFKKLHQFLREEEESRMKALREEEEQKTQRMKDMMAAVSRDMEAVSQSVSETEELLRAADASFLLQYKTAAKRLQQRPLVERWDQEL
uniref:B box-type domain-containing protein n=1 Tax=Neogobius melanostomus TaxID=47308 RepID=A0A8C6T2L8_9GOBI